MASRTLSIVTSALALAFSAPFYHHVPNIVIILQNGFHPLSDRPDEFDHVFSQVAFSYRHNVS